MTGNQTNLTNDYTSLKRSSKTSSVTWWCNVYNDHHFPFLFNCLLQDYSSLGRIPR